MGDKRSRCLALSGGGTLDLDKASLSQGADSSGGADLAGSAVAYTRTRTQDRHRETGREKGSNESMSVCLSSP